MQLFDAADDASMGNDAENGNDNNELDEGEEDGGAAEALNLVSSDSNATSSDDEQNQGSR